MNLEIGETYFLAVSWGVFSPDESWWSNARAELSGDNGVAKAWTIENLKAVESSAYALKWGAAIALASLTLF